MIENDIQDRLANNLYYYRVNKRKLSRAELFERSKVSVNTIGRIENSVGYPKLDIVEKLANSLGIDVITLLKKV